MRFARFLSLVLLCVLPLMTASFVSAQSAPASQPAPQTQANAPQSPSGQAYNLPPDKLAKAKTLNKIRLTLEIAGSIWGLVVIWLLLASRTAGAMGAWAARCSRRRWIQGLLFFAAFFIITTIAGLPLDAIGHVVSRHYSISVQGWASWLGDQAKGLGLTLGIGCWVMLLFNWIVKVSPRRYWLWMWVISLPLILAGAMAGPLFEPIFNKFEPLSKNNAALVADLQKVVARTGTNIPTDRMYLMKASEKTNGLNAYVSGFGPTKRIVVWDTTAGRVPNDEVMFVFGHESGHYVLHHIQKGLAAAAVFFFFVFWICGRLAEGLVNRYGERWDIRAEEGVWPLATRAGFLTILLMVSLVGFLLAPINNSFSRYIEHQADVYGQEAIHGLVPDPQRTAVAGFNALGAAWLEDPDPNPFVEFWLYNHPSVKNRANFAAHYDPWANGGHGEFFQK